MPSILGIWASAIRKIHGAHGSFPTITLSPPLGSVDAAATGGLGTVTVTTVDGGATGGTAGATEVQATCFAFDGSHGTVGVTLAGAPANGNMLVAVYTSFGGDPGTPSGWTKVSWTSMGGDSVGLYWKVCSSGESATQNLFTGNTNNGALTMWEVNGQSSFVGSNVSGVSAATTITPSGVTTSNANTLILGALHARDVSSPVVAPTVAAGATQDASNADSSSSRTCVGGHKLVVTSGTSATVVFNMADTNYDRAAVAIIQIH